MRGDSQMQANQITDLALGFAAVRGKAAQETTTAC